jgi:hypothetical protein
LKTVTYVGTSTAVRAERRFILTHLLLARLAVAVVAVILALAPFPVRAQEDAAPTPAPAFTLNIPGLPPVALRPALPHPRRALSLAPVIAAGPVTGPAYYHVQPGDTIDGIAATLGSKPLRSWRPTA